MWKYELFIFDWDGTLYSPFSLLDHVIEVLDKLRIQNKSLAVATGHSRIGLDSALADTNTGHYFITTKTASECFSKPHPQMISEILDFTGISKDRAVMVGDNPSDIQMAKAAGIDAIGINQDPYVKSELAKCNPTFLFNDLKDFYEQLTQDLNNA